ncbi:excisionase family DNA-binding protein [Bradyrhizobium septentrionale]|uniref:Excisionase family DNA-binding protein n=1 Tax=Bradyrhizobium septentrionale TaxID=1404411 RepID=A0A973W5I4_9BRAD|nr:excisionase family DNA-binding protein [Bradyrhizobium septentrionale]UGY16269.1 excisionase family DNA-binding protein [Bradyrhizobium septentrionale]UGY24902.1 excisionase family DNA-binding protein [Bradyrhizobium septentrionale]
MTLPAYAEELGGRLPSETERASANQLRTIFAAYAAGDTKLRLVDDQKQTREIALGPALSALLIELLRHIGKGDAVTLVPVHEMLTTQQAADVLNVSRPFFISLLDKAQIPYETVGRHRRIKAEDLFAYKRARDKKRSEALSALAEEDGELL